MADGVQQRGLLTESGRGQRKEGAVSSLNSRGGFMSNITRSRKV